MREWDEPTIKREGQSDTSNGCSVRPDPTSTRYQAKNALRNTMAAAVGFSASDSGTALHELSSGKKKQLCKELRKVRGKAEIGETSNSDLRRLLRVLSRAPRHERRRAQPRDLAQLTCGENRFARVASKRTTDRYPTSKRAADCSERYSLGQTKRLSEPQTRASVSWRRRNTHASQHYCARTTGRIRRYDD